MALGLAWLALPGVAAPVAPAFAPLHESALPVLNPAQVILISVTRAGNRLVAVGDHGDIVYSDDNGQSWHQAQVPVDIVITCVAFATPQVGWAAGDYGTVLKTTDGGLSWTPQIYGDQVLQMQVDTANAALAANPNDDGAQHAVKRAGIMQSGGPDKPFLAITAFSPQHAIIFGSYRMALVTNDGGQTWADWSLHIGDPVSHNLYFADWVGSTLWLAGEVGTMLRSDDQGNTFTLQPSYTQNTLLGMVAIGTKTFITYGVAGALYRSTDGGNTWNEINVPTTSNLPAGLLLQDGVVVIASEDGRIFVSHDQGASYTELPNSAGMGLFGAVQAANGDVVFVGDGGVRVMPQSALN